MFAFNNMSQQQAIAAEGGIRFSCFIDFLQSDDEYFRCNTAFQVKHILTFNALTLTANSV